jgi:NADH-quinone oxidoreductase subunit N
VFFNQWGAMVPEFIVMGTAALLFLLDALWPNQLNRKPLAIIAFTGVMLSIVALINLLQVETVSIWSNSFRLDSFAKAFKWLMLFAAALILLLAVNAKTHLIKGYYGFFLTALFGAMIASSSGHLLSIFFGLELLMLASYIIAVGEKKQVAPVMKYIKYGGISSAMMLFGISFLIGLTGTANLQDMNEAMQSIVDSQLIYLLSFALFIILIGLCVKLSAFPICIWAPDIYETAPAPTIAFISVIMKIAGFVILLRIFLSLALVLQGDQIGAYTFFEKHTIVWSILAGVIMVVGTLYTVVQQHTMRIFAYINMAQTGYLFVSFASLGGDYFLFDSFWFYLGSCLFINIGGLSVIQAVTRTGTISDFTGLYSRSPFLAWMMVLFLFSLIGIPGTAGFIGKVYLLLGAFTTEPGQFGLAAVMLGVLCGSAIFYFTIITRVFFKSAETHKRIHLSTSTIIVLLICGAGTIVLGIAPKIGLDFLLDHFSDFTDFLN